MLKTSELQSQIALNSKIISDKEFCKTEEKENIKIHKDLLKRFPEHKYSTWMLDLDNAKYHYLKLKREIVQYAKLQRALKREMAYIIQRDRVVKGIIRGTKKTKNTGLEVIIAEEQGV